VILAYPNCTAGIKYAEQVLSGKVVAGRYVKLACKRFYADCERDDIYLDSAAAEYAIGFIQELSHTKGRWAQRGEKFLLEPWQKFKFLQLFGWYRTSTKCRRFNEVYNEIARKNGKSIDAAATGIFMLAGDGEYGAEVYCGATSEKQAHEVWTPASRMLKIDHELTDILGIEVHAKSIFRPEDNSTFQCVIGDPPDGSSPHFGIVDEYHEHKKDAVYKTFQTGMGARQNPILYVITTAGDNINGPCHEKRQECIQILEGVLHDDHADSTLVMIYAADEDRGEDFWMTEEALLQANPNFDVSVAGDWLRKQQQQAIRSVKDQGYFKTKHLNLWVNQTDPFINYEDWKQCGDESMKIEDFAMYPCKMGIDLSSRIDFTASGKIFYNDDMDGKRHYHWFPEFWLPEDKREEYPAWGEYINFTEGNEIDTKAVKRKLAEDIEAYMIEEVTFDPWKSAGFEQELENLGPEITKFPQTIGQYTMPMNEFEAAIMSGRLHHPNNPVLNWMLTNLHAKRDTNGNCKPRKEDQKKKIDGIVAGIMAIGRSMPGDEEKFSMEIFSL